MSFSNPLAKDQVNAREGTEIIYHYRLTFPQHPKNLMSHWRSHGGGGLGDTGAGPHILAGTGIVELPKTVDKLCGM